MRRHPFLWSFDLSTPTPTFTFPTDAERIAEVLADIKADLERRHVTDPKVWSGYPWPEGVEDEDMPRVHVGLFEQLVRCTRGAPTLGKMASAIRITAELTQAVIVGRAADQDEVERVVDAMEKRAKGVRKGGKKTGGEKQAANAESERVMKGVWRAYRGQFGSDRALAEGMRDRKCKYMDAGRERVFVPHVEVERARALLGEWAREEKWAAGWSAVDGEYHQRTPNGYHVEVSSEGGSWRLRVKAPDGEEWTPKGSGPLKEVKDAGYHFVEALRKQARARRAKWTGKIAGRAARLPSSTSRT
jgi:hypothetical protein